MEDGKKKYSGRMGWMQAMPDFISRNALLLVEILLFILLYICNRYAYQRDQVAAERLRREIVDMQFQTLNTTSDVSAKSKLSYIETVVTRNGSGLKATTEPSYRLSK
ncbi:MAG: hypothetical protein MJY96_07625 [Bacteroidaceae bacterium]|nr:hypothetical protein [Candidatus Colenecus caballi]MCQ2072978.1 hypothetical protein [Bacteroidaceae bacterium]